MGVERKLATSGFVEALNPRLTELIAVAIRVEDCHGSGADERVGRRAATAIEEQYQLDKLFSCLLESRCSVS
jgi:hypothetical protein